MCELAISNRPTRFWPNRHHGDWLSAHVSAWHLIDGDQRIEYGTCKFDSCGAKRWRQRQSESDCRSVSLAIL
jgi:hypothetical protein